MERDPPALEVLPRQSVAIRAPDPHLVADWLASKSERTRRAYAGDLERFADWASLPGVDAAARHLLAAGPRGARHLALTYRAHLQGRGLSPATVSRALAALRSVVALARDAGEVDWTLNVKGPTARAYRDTAGPPPGDVAAILDAADLQASPAKAARDGALLRLLYGLGLRRAEASGLDCAHLEAPQGGPVRVWVLGKGKADREPLTVPPWVAEALERWIAFHPAPAPSSPLFVALDRVALGRRLRPQGVAVVLRDACARAGVRRYAPHALRHAAVTHALDLTGGDVRRVRAFSRHAKIETVARYDDNRRDGAGAVAALLDPSRLRKDSLSGPNPHDTTI